MNDAREFLKQILSSRVSHNPRYTLKDYSKDLAISPQQLSNFLNGKRGISPAKAEACAVTLGLSELEKMLFCESAKAKFSRSRAQRLVASHKYADLIHQNQKSKILDVDRFKVISNWHHFALVDLIKLCRHSNPKNAVAWFAKKLNISENETRMSLGRLERLKLVHKTSKGWAVSQNAVVVDRTAPTEAIRSYHRQILERSLLALDQQSADERYGYSNLVPIKVKSVAKAKELIREFTDRFNNEVKDTSSGEEIYGLAIQFFRLTQAEVNK